MTSVVRVQVSRWAFLTYVVYEESFHALPDHWMTQTPAQQQETRLAGAGYRSVPREYVDPPSAWNPTVGLFFGGYALAALTIWGWFLGDLIQSLFHLKSIVLVLK